MRWHRRSPRTLGPRHHPACTERYRSDLFSVQGAVSCVLCADACHGLTSKPRESASEPFLNELLGLFKYPLGSVRALLAGTLSLRFCAALLVEPLLGGCL